MIKTQILVVEDKDILAKRLEERLNRLGYGVAGVASSGAEAVKKAAELRPDLVLMDIALEGEREGREAAKQIYARFDIPVIYLVAASEEGTSQRAKIAEPFGYIFNPFQEKDLQTVIETALYRHSVEKKFREAEAGDLTLVEPFPVIIYLAALDEVGSTLYISPQIESLLGFSQAEWLADPALWVKQLHPDDRERVLAEVCRVSTEGRSFRSEYRLRTRSGHVKWLYDEAVVVRDNVGKPLFLQGIVLDITERKREEEKLRRQNKSLAALHQTTLGLMNRLELEDLLKVIIARAGALLDTPHGFIYLTEPGETELVAKVGAGLFSRWMAPRLKPGEGLSGKVWQTGQPLVVEGRRAEPGRLSDFQLDVLCSMVGMPLKSGSQVVGVLGLAYLEEGRRFGDEEITLLSRFAGLASIALDNARLYTSTQRELAERKQTEEVLRENEVRQVCIVETIAEGILIIDRDGRITFANAAAEKIFGLPRTVLTQRTYDDPAWKVTTLDGKPVPAEDRSFFRVMRTGKPIYNLEQVLERPDGTRIISSRNAVPLRDAAGAIVGVVVSLTDMTERWQAKEALRKAYDDLELQVEERTAELSKANKILKEQINERERAEEKLRQQNEYLTALHETTLALINRLELADLLETIVTRAGALAGTPHGFIYLAEAGEMAAKVAVGACSRFMGHRLKPGQGVMGRVWQTGQPLAVEDYRSWPHRLPDPCFDILHATVGIPLKSGSEVIGIIGLDYLEEGRSFQAEEIELLSRFAALASLALDNARLYASAQQELAERKRVEEALRESEERYRLLFESTPHPLWVYDVETLGFLAANGAAARHYGYSRQEFLGMTLQDLHLTEDLPGMFDRISRLTGQADWTGILRHRKKDGTLLEVEVTSHPLIFGGRRARLALATDITQRRQAEERLRQQNEYLTALHETTLDLMNRLKLDDLLEAIVRRAGALVGTEHGSISLVEPGGTGLVIRVGVGVFSKLIGYRVKPDEGLTGKVWCTGQPLVLADYHTWPGRVSDPRFEVLRAAVAIPVKSDQQVVGVIGLAHLEEGRTFGDDETLLLSRFAELASIALDKARLYTLAQEELAERKRAEQELHQRFNQLQTVYHITAAISRAGALEEIYEEALNSLRRALKADRTSISLFDPDGVMRFKAWRRLSEGYRAAIEGYSPWPLDARNPQPILFTDVEKEPGLEALQTVILDEGIRAMGFIPLISQGRLLGKFTIYYDTSRLFSEEDLQLVQTIASHIASAIERKRAEEALRENEEHYRALFNQACKMQEQLRDLSREVLRVQEEERKRISQELHDEIGQALTAIDVNLEMMKKQSAWGRENLKKRIDDIQSLTKQTLDSVHRFARELRPAMLDDLGLLPALRWYTRGFAERTGIQVRLRASAAAERLGNEQKTVMYRVVQESLTNVSKHAGASKVDIFIKRTPNGIRMEIRDDGKAFRVGQPISLSQGKGLGLLGMQERVEFVNGKFAVESERGKGTTVHVEIPFK